MIVLFVLQICSPTACAKSWIYTKLTDPTPEQNDHNFVDDIFKSVFMNEIFCIMIRIWLKLAPKGPINNIPALVQIMAWRRSGDKPLSESMLTQFTDAYMRH